MVFHKTFARPAAFLLANRSILKKGRGHPR
jgi:hypothetical protein